VACDHRPVPRDPEPARRSLIAAGERLFAERGIGAVSLREINKAAGQRNSSALHYHFRSREGLLRAIMARHADLIRSRRLELLEELDGRSAPADAWSAARALVEPVTPVTVPLEHGRSGRAFARILPQVLTDPVRPGPEVADVVGDTARGHAYELLAPHCAALPERVVRERLAVLQLHVVHAVADRARVEDSRRTNRSLEPLSLFVANLTDMFVASLLGPVSPATMDALRASGPAGRPRALVRRSQAT
jgi:AcrR family transcriptional regulator